MLMNYRVLQSCIYSIVAEIICVGKLPLGGFHRVPNPLYETLLFTCRLVSQPMFVTKSEGCPVLPQPVPEYT